MDLLTDNRLALTRREFLGQGASGIGAAALASLLGPGLGQAAGARAGGDAGRGSGDPRAVRLRGAGEGRAHENHRGDRPVLRWARGVFTVRAEGSRGVAAGHGMHLFGGDYGVFGQGRAAAEGGGISQAARCGGVFGGFSGRKAPFFGLIALGQGRGFRQLFRLFGDSSSRTPVEPIGQPVVFSWHNSVTRRGAARGR